MTPPTELLIVRHGEAHCNVNQTVGGRVGCRGLTQAGSRQVHQLAQRLTYEHAERPFAALYTSPLRRARESAGFVAEAIDLPTQVESDLAETDYGTADGQPWPDVVHAFDGISAYEPDRPIAPGAETWASYLQRSRNALEKLLHRHQGQRFIVIGHGETVVTAAHHFLDLPMEVTTRAGFAAYPASITRWAQQPASWVRPELGWRWALVTHNDTRHTEHLNDPGRAAVPTSFKVGRPTMPTALTADGQPDDDSIVQRRG